MSTRDQIEKGEILAEVFSGIVTLTREVITFLVVILAMILIIKIGLTTTSDDLRNALERASRGAGEMSAIVVNSFNEGYGELQ
ncbi:MAG: hypothetical protein ACR2QF_10220 [Geminicoccaceae bacterium]